MGRIRWLTKDVLRKFPAQLLSRQNGDGYAEIFSFIEKS